MIDQYRVLELPEYIEGDLFATDREGVDRDGRTLDRRRVDGLCADHAGCPVFVCHLRLFSSKLLNLDWWEDRVAGRADLYWTIQAQAGAAAERTDRVASPPTLLKVVATICWLRIGPAALP